MPITQTFRDHFTNPDSGSAEGVLLKLENEDWPEPLYLTDILTPEMWVEEEEGYRLTVGADNSLLWSDAWDNAVWARIALLSVTADVGDTTDPDGGNTAEHIIPTTTTGNHYIQQVVDFSPNQLLTFAVWLKYKAGGPPWVRLQIYDTDSTSHQITCYFGIQTGVVGTANNVGNGTLAVGAIVNADNGWKLCILRGKPNTSGTRITLRIVSAAANGNSTYTGDGVNGWYAWRAQLESGLILHKPLQETTTEAVFNRNDYWWAPFEITEPNMDDEEPRGSMSIPNVNDTKEGEDEIGQRLALLTTPIKLTATIVLKSDPTEVLVDPLVLMDVTAIRGNRANVSGDIGWPKLGTEPVPFETIDPSEFRCAFRSIT